MTSVSLNITDYSNCILRIRLTFHLGMYLTAISQCLFLDRVLLTNSPQLLTSVIYFPNLLEILCSNLHRASPSLSPVSAFRTKSTCAMHIQLDHTMSPSTCITISALNTHYYTDTYTCTPCALLLAFR